MDRRELLSGVQRIVVKIGSSSLSSGAHLSRDKMSLFVTDVAQLVRRGYHVTVVTSGAISAGASRMKRSRSLLTIPEKQALAAVGQTILIDEYRKLFLEVGLDIGQILLAGEDVVNRSRFLNARNAIRTLLDMGVVPIANENDTVSVNEIKLGDNDTLSAYVSQIVEADLVILLSDIDGFYMSMSDDSPIAHICDITDEIWRAAGGSGSSLGTGGMYTKVRAADMIVRSGGKMMIAKAGVDKVLNRLLDGENIGTIFSGSGKALDGRRRWIAFNMDASGLIRIDDGAVRALIDNKKSLLPAGIVSCEGKFDAGDAVDIVTAEGRRIARGISNYTSQEVEKIKGCKTAEISGILGDSVYDEVVHRDDMIVF